MRPVNGCENIKAQKQVLVLDACHSGQIVEKLASKKEIPADQQRSLERLAGRTGTYVLAALASGQSAFEMTRYGQGILAYNLLLGIKSGKGLADNKYLNVSNWFNFAVNQVEDMAKEVGGRQNPEIISQTSFDIGIVDSSIRNSITLSTKKPIFSRSLFLNTDVNDDDLRLAKLFENKLGDLSYKGGKLSPLFFFSEYEGSNAHRINGNYNISGNKIKGSISLLSNNKSISSYPINTSVNKLNGFIDDIMNKIISKVDESN